MKKYTGPWPPEDLKTLIRLQNERAISYCSTCGGNKRIRVHITGADELDFEICPTCHGRGIPQKMKATAYERLIKPWIEEFEKK